MRDFKIRKNIPIPIRPRNTKWAMVAQKMASGDSVVLENRNQATSLKNALARYGKDSRIITLDGSKIGVWVKEQGE